MKAMTKAPKILLTAAVLASLLGACKQRRRCDHHHASRHLGDHAKQHLGRHRHHG